MTTSSWSIRVRARLLLHLGWLLNGGLRSVNPSRSLTLTSALSRPRGGRLFMAGFMTSRGPGLGFCWRVARSRALALARTCSALARLIPPAAVRRSSLWIVLFWSWVTGFGSLSPRPTTRGRLNAGLSRGRRSSPGKLVMIPGRAWLRGRSSSRCLSRFPPGLLGSWIRSLAVLGRPWCPGRRRHRRLLARVCVGFWHRRLLARVWAVLRWIWSPRRLWGHRCRRRGPRLLPRLRVRRQWSL